MAPRPPSGSTQGRRAAADFGGSGKRRVVLDQAALDELLESPDGAVGKQILRGVTRIERQAKRLAPVDTGRLRSSITHSVEKDRIGLVGVVGTNVDYAPFVEFGTRRMSARSFLRAALGAFTEAGR